MRSRVEEIRIAEALRLWVLFDSDAREPGKPSEQSEKLRSACDRAKVTHHQLRRRMIESYLPSQVLHLWAEQSRGRERVERRKKAAAFAQMEPPQRHHYNMKGGFNTDENEEAPNRGISPLFDDWLANKYLREGFGRGITVLFRQKSIKIEDNWLHRDKQGAETLAMIESLLRQM
jgi:hypothetical protein